MVYHERAAWSGLITGILTLTAYVVIVLTHSGGGDLTAVDWLPIMLWTIGGGIVLSILITILWGIGVGMRDRESATASDMRDTDIARRGGRIEHALLIAAGLGVIALCAVGADVFWIASTMFVGFAVSAIVGGVARVVAYRRGLI